MTCSMPIPDLIEIIPLQTPVRSRITVPGSKSITNRALILAALSEGKTALRGALWSEDTQVMCDCLRKLGFSIEIASDPHEPCNRTITVQGCGGRIPNGGTREHPLELFVGNSGTSARFLSAFVCLGDGFYRLHGIERMHSRPQAPLFSALRALGYAVEGQTLPAVIQGRGPREGMCSVNVSESSQFASALLLSAQRGKWQVNMTGDDADEMPYVAMTRKLMEVFPSDGGQFQIEPDASGASYFCAADWVLRSAVGTENSHVEVADYPQSDWQIDAAFPRFLPLPPVVSRKTDLADGIMTAIVISVLGKTPVQFTDLERLRVQECERVQALKTELAKCGAHVIEKGETLRVTPGPVHGAEIETYNDHRVAMCFAILGLKIPGIRIKNPSCVKKTFPDFFQKLSALPAKGGLGAGIFGMGRALSAQELFAD